MTDKLSLKDVVAMGLGGTIGGGIFAALGVAVTLAGNGAVLTFLIAGIVALVSGYSYLKLTDMLNEDGGSYTFIEHYIDNPNIAGFSGWILIIGYIGTMALYAYAFGSFLNSVVSAVFGIPEYKSIRIILSLMVIGILLLINLQGTALSGKTEFIMVLFKITILIIFGLIGILGIIYRPELQFLPGGVVNKGLTEAIVAVPVIFVSFEGFELLSYEYSEMEGGIETLKKGIYMTIIAATVIYILIVLSVTGVLHEAEIVANEETVLAVLGQHLFTSQALSDLSFGLIVFTALLSTTSAINATMYGTARLITRIARKKQLPDMYSRHNHNNVPHNSLYLISGLTAILTIAGSLTQITVFASLSFIVLFLIVNYIAFRDKKTITNQWLLGFGIVATALILIIFLIYLIQNSPDILISIFGIYLVLGIIELLFIKRVPRAKPDVLS